MIRLAPLPCPYPCQAAQANPYGTGCCPWLWPSSPHLTPCQPDTWPAGPGAIPTSLGGRRVSVGSELPQLHLPSLEPKICFCPRQGTAGPTTYLRRSMSV